VECSQIVVPMGLDSGNDGLETFQRPRYTGRPLRLCVSANGRPHIQSASTEPSRMNVSMARLTIETRKCSRWFKIILDRIFQLESAGVSIVEWVGQKV
jgi:hypothetical protein